MCILRPICLLFSVVSTIVLLLHLASRVVSRRERKITLDVYCAHLYAQGHKVVNAQDNMGSSAPTFVVHLMLSANNNLFCEVHSLLSWRLFQKCPIESKSKASIHYMNTAIPPLQIDTSLHAIFEVRTNHIKTLYEHRRLKLMLRCM